MFASQDLLFILWIREILLHFVTLKLSRLLLDSLAKTVSEEPKSSILKNEWAHYLRQES